jgi:SAM-dependent methyltransferase
LAEFTGERIIPDQVEEDLLNEHVARYAFAVRLARMKRVLDAGCGTGYGSAELAKQATLVVGADQSAEAIAYAHDHYRLPNLRFERATCTALPHADASFDLVLAFEVIEHLDQWVEFLLEVRRVLTLNGLFVVSTPNKLYYRETRRMAGPNPFHRHEFDFAEFRDELAQVFPYQSLFLENHVAGVVFQPVEPYNTAEVRVDGVAVEPDDSHFFVAVCARRPQTETPTFVYVPRSANLLRERERHIELLENELRTKNGWLEEAKGNLVALNRDHQKVLDMFRAQTKELEERNRWAGQLNRELEKAREAYEVKTRELEEENRAKTQWALDIEKRLGAELEARSQELVRCVELLQENEKIIQARTQWAQELQAHIDQIEQQLNLVRASRWMKLGRKFRLGPPLPGS